MRYDPTYEATIATVIPLVFVAIVVDLGLAKRSTTPLAAGTLLAMIIVLLASELLCLNALSNNRNLRGGESDLVAGAVLFSGVTVLYRVGEPLLKIVVTHALGRWMVRGFIAEFVVLVVLHQGLYVSGGTAVVIFAMSALIVGVLAPAWLTGIAGFVQRRMRPRRVWTPDQNPAPVTEAGKSAGESRPDSIAAHSSTGSHPRWTRS